MQKEQKLQTLKNDMKQLKVVSSASQKKSKRMDKVLKVRFIKQPINSTSKIN